jgi:hypothetical protein
MDGTPDGKLLVSSTKQRGRLGDEFVHVPHFISAESGHDTIVTQKFKNKGGTGQVRFRC